MEQLYAQYGKLLIEAEIINGKLLEIKKLIVEGLNKEGKDDRLDSDKLADNR